MTGTGLVPTVAVYMFRPLFLSLTFFSLVGTIVLNAGDPRLRLLRDPRLVYLGSISYGIYLYHHFIFEICKSFQIYYGWRENLFSGALELGASIALAALSWKLVEQPILSLKDRFSYREAVSSDLGTGRTGENVHGAQVG